MQLTYELLGHDPAIEDGASRLFADAWPAARPPRAAGDIGWDRLPLTIVACSDGIGPVGAVSLICAYNSTAARVVLMLANLVVAADHRDQGIGSAMIARVMSASALLGSGALYAITSRQRLFRRLGWRESEVAFSCPSGCVALQTDDAVFLMHGRHDD
jgi:predicted N-acetyltransferase YhbS